MQTKRESMKSDTTKEIEMNAVQPGVQRQQARQQEVERMLLEVPRLELPGNLTELFARMRQIRNNPQDFLVQHRLFQPANQNNPGRNQNNPGPNQNNNLGA